MTLERPPGLLSRRIDDILFDRPPTVGRLLIAAAVLMVAATVVVLGLATAGGEGSGGLPFVTIPPATIPEEPEVVVVHVAGAAVRPGLYRRPAGDRVADLIDAAGGALANARPDMLNLAAHLVDGSRVWVPSDDDQVDPMPSAEAGSVNALINVNRATAEQLEALPGVGPSLAAAIVDHRGRSGPVSTVDDLLSVPGIGPGKLAALRDRVVV